MIDIPVLQLTSCVRCKNIILGNPREHLAICEKLGRLDEAIEELYGDGYDSLSLEQIGLLVDFLLTTELSGCFIAGIVSDHEEKDIATVLCPYCLDMVNPYGSHNCGVVESMVGSVEPEYVALSDCDEIFKVKRVEDGCFFLEDEANGNIISAQEEHIDHTFQSKREAEEWKESLIPDDVPHPFFREDYQNLRIER